MAKIERVLTDDELEGLFLGEIKKEEAITKQQENQKFHWMTFDDGQGVHDAAWDRDYYELDNNGPEFVSPERLTEDQLAAFFERNDDDSKILKQ